jgi:ABC-type nitrate/sulfonate/bicarbonate transport system substrate-binding protein
MTFLIEPHFRLHEWVAEEKGYFKAEGLDYEFRETIQSSDGAAHNLGDKVGAYQTFEKGRACDVSGACHWAINASAAAGSDRMYGKAYSVAPGGIYVAADSPVRKPEDLAEIEIAVGYHSGSHFSTLQALEPVFDPSRARLRFTGEPMDRLEQMLDGGLQAANVFGPPAYVLEQNGFRKVLDTTFVVAFLVSADAEPVDVERYISALLRAQRDIDLEAHRYKHYYLRELPETLHSRVDVRAFGPGERVVAAPYPREVYEETQRWLSSIGILRDQEPARSYEEAVLV